MLHLAYLVKPHFRRSHLFRALSKSSQQLLFHSNQFNTKFTPSEQLLLQSSCIFEAAIFSKQSLFSRIYILAAGLSPSKKEVIICFNASPLKIMKNAFYFMIKALFVLGIFAFVLTFWLCRKTVLNQKPKVNFKIYEQTTIIHILSISQEAKDNDIWPFNRI